MWASSAYRSEYGFEKGIAVDSFETNIHHQIISTSTSKDGTTDRKSVV
jgi:hypothetical protein